MQIKAGTDGSLWETTPQFLSTLLRPYILVFHGIRHADARPIYYDNPAPIQTISFGFYFKLIRQVLMYGFKCR